MGTYLRAHNDFGLQFANDNGVVRMEIEDGGNVGIGTGSPTEKLDVNGTVKMTGFQLTGSRSAGDVLTSDASGVGTWQTVDEFTIPVNDSLSTTAPLIRMTNLYSGNAGIAFYGKHEYSGNYGYIGSNNYGVYGRHGASGNQGILGLSQYGVYGNSSTGWAGYFVGDVYSSGDVGIGTITPSARLDVVGTVEAQGLKLTTGATDGYVLTSDASGSGTWQPASPDSDWVISGDEIYSGVTGNVGIGTTNTYAKLHVYGDLMVGLGSNGYDVNFFGDYSGSRLFWNESKMALRAGRDSDYNHWDEDSTGRYSTALGYNTKAVGLNSTALCRITTARGHSAFATGSESKANGDYSTAMGAAAHANGEYSTAIGLSLNADGQESMALGSLANATGRHSVALGYYVQAGPADQTITIGVGDIYSGRLENNVANSLMVGFNTTTPTLFVGGSGHRVGIGTSSPSNKLHVFQSSGNPKLEIESDSGTPQIEFDGTSGNFDIEFLESDTFKASLGWDSDNNRFFLYESGVNALISNNGYIGIRTVNPLEALHVNGEIYVATMYSTSSGVPVRYYNNRLYQQSSSRKYKDQIQTLQDDFDKILDAEPVSFTDKVSGEQCIGFIAEEFADLGLDNLVVERDGEPDAIRYELVSLYLLEVIKDQNKRIEELEQVVCENGNK
jgi:hypothetical protein